MRFLKCHILLLTGLGGALVFPQLAFGALSLDCLSVLSRVSQNIIRAERLGGENKPVISLVRELRDVIRTYGDNEDVRRFFEVASTLPVETLERIVRVVSAMKETAKTGVFWRAVSLHGNEQDIRNFLALLANGNRPLDEINFTRLRGSPAEADVAVALTRFRSHPQTALNHIWDGEIRMDTVNARMPVIAFGVHSIEAFQSFLRQRVQHRMNQNPEFRRLMTQTLVTLRERLAEPTNRRPPPSVYREIEEMGQIFASAGIPAGHFMDWERRRQESYNWNFDPVHQRRDHLQELGLDTSPENLIPFTIGFGDHIGMHATENGVIRVRFPRNSYRSQAWDQSIIAAESGLIPIGGKTLFPRGWTAIKVQQAIEHVLASANSTVLSGRNSTGSKQLHYIVNTFDGVRLAVGIVNGNVVTAFPTWRQRLPESSAHMYAEYQESMGRLTDRLRELQSKVGFSRRITIEDLCSTYLGRESEVHGLTDADKAELRLLVNPTEWEFGPDNWTRGAAFSAGYMHGAISEYLQAQALARQVERIGFR